MKPTWPSEMNPINCVRRRLDVSSVLNNMVMSTLTQKRFGKNSGSAESRPAAAVQATQRSALLGMPEQPFGPEKQNATHHQQRKDCRERCAEVHVYQAIGQAQEQPCRDCPSQAPEATEHDDHQALGQ